MNRHFQKMPYEDINPIIDQGEDEDNEEINF